MDRSPQTIPVKEVTSAIDPTRQYPVQDFSGFGQTEYLQAEEAKQAEEYEKELEFDDPMRAFELKIMSMERYAA